MIRINFKIILVLIVSIVLNEASYSAPSPIGTEYNITGALLGDQVKPRIVINDICGYIAWEDNAIDGSGQGIGLSILDKNGTRRIGQTYKVNQTINGDQQNPDIALFSDGKAIIVWESGTDLDKDIYFRLISPSGEFLTPEIRANVYTEGLQINPKVGVLPEDKFVIVWTSIGQDGHLAGVFGRIFQKDGKPLTEEIPINVFTPYNQRDPAVGVLKDGTFVVVWVTENQSYPQSVNIAARRFSKDGVPLIDEVRVDSGTNICANPTILATSRGPFFIGWSSRNIYDTTNRWDVVVKGYGLDGNPITDELIINEFRLGDQYRIRLAESGGIIMAIWSSLGQDESWEEVYGRFIDLTGKPLSTEFRVNTTTISRQVEPDLSSVGEQGFLVVWSSFIGGEASFELLGQRYSFEDALQKPAPPLAIALDSRNILISWPELGGFKGVEYLIYLDGSTKPLQTSNLFIKIGNLVPQSDHFVQMAYKLPDGRISPLSDVVVVRTWGWDNNFDGLPDDWQAKYWGPDPRKWPSPLEDSDGDGVNNRDEFLAGTDPVDPASVLKVSIHPSPYGLIIEWNGIRGSVYVIEASDDLKEWNQLGEFIIAPEEKVSILVNVDKKRSYYRVTRVR